MKVGLNAINQLNVTTQLSVVT